MQKTYSYSKTTTLEYYLFGTGSKILVCFHGFNETPKHFSFLANTLTNYTIVSISLFYHGNSQRLTHNYLKIKEWEPIITGLLDELNITRFSILAYSMGGRFATCTFQKLHHRINHLILIAPDGIIKRFWYEFATSPIGLNRLFRFFMYNPYVFLKFIKVLEHLRLMNSSTSKFAMNQLSQSNQRMQVYKCWMAFKHFIIKPIPLAKLINMSKTRCVFIFGKYDKVIPFEQHKKFLKLAHSSKSYVLENGHQKLVPASIKIINRTLES